MLLLLSIDLSDLAIDEGKKVLFNPNHVKRPSSLSLSLSLSLSVESDGRDIKKLIQSCGTTLMRYAGGVHLITACPTVTRYGRKRVSPVAFQPVEPISFYVIVAVVVGVLLWSLVRRRPKCSRRPPLFLFIYFLFFSFVFFWRCAPETAAFVLRPRALWATRTFTHRREGFCQMQMLWTTRLFIHTLQHAAATVGWRRKRASSRYSKRSNW